MGTRSLTHIYEKANSEKPFVTIYRQFDGYPSGMGEDIKKALGEKTLVNGYSDPRTETNGMPCAAAMLIAAIKEGCGNVYLYPAGTEDCGEDYVYRLYPAGDRFRFVIDGEYDGPLHEFDSAKAERKVA